MPNAKIDANTHNTWGLYNETTGLVEPARVDAATGALLIFNSANLSAPTVGSYNRSAIDGNTNHALAGFDNTTGSIESLRCDTSGNLIVVPQ